MTCVVGLKTDKGVYIGADSCVSSGNLLLPAREKGKIFKKGPFLFASCGDVRGENILHFSVTLTKRNDKQSVENFLYNTFLDDMRDCFKKAGFSSKHNDKERHSNAFLFVYEGRLFTLSYDYSIIEVKDYMAEGSGRTYALGSLFSTDGVMQPKARVRSALEAAARHNAFVAPPYSIRLVKP